MKKLILGFVILIVVATLLIGCAPKTKIYTPEGGQVIEEPMAAPEAPAVTPPTGAPVSAPAATSGLEETTLPELKDCETAYAIGWVPNSCKVEGKAFSITLKAVGKGGIDGLVFYVEGPTGRQVMLKDSTKVESGGEQAYAFSLSELEEKVGGRVQQILALPIKQISGTDYACFNQRLLIIKDEACRA